MKLLKPLVILLMPSAVVAYLLFWSDDVPSFPTLPAGSYVGSIREEDGSLTSLYLERFRKAPLFLFVIFKEGWSPQTKRIVPVAGGMNYAPIELEFPEGRLEFRGKAHDGEINGTIIGPGELTRKWTLQRVSSEKISATGNELLVTGEPFEQWLKFKLAVQSQQNKMLRVEQELKEAEFVIEKLELNIKDEKTLKARAEEQRDELQVKVTNARAERKVAKSDVKKLVRELELLERIKEKGKLVRTARKLASRENKWYSANWTTGEDSTRVEEFLGDRLKIDVRSLERDNKKAREIRNYLTQIRTEEAKIARLKEIYKDATSNARNASNSGAKNSIWERYKGRSMLDL